MEGAADQSTVRLFQYGSNMHREGFLERIKRNEDHVPAGTRLDARLVGRASLDGWRLHANLWSATLERRKRRDPSLGDARASRVVNIVREDGAEAWGALYEIAADLVTRCDGELRGRSPRGSSNDKRPGELREDLRHGRSRRPAVDSLDVYRSA